MSTTTGTVKWFNEAKGFEFTVTQGQKGPQAENIVAV
jgi:cold shock CspA family protein